MLFRDLVADWKKNHLAGMSPRTIEGYESNLRLRILPSFGTMQLGKIEKYHVRQFFDKLQQPDCEFLGKKYNLSPATIKNHLACMNSIFSYAVYKEYIKESPMKGVKTPPVKRKRPDLYQKEDIAAMMGALKNEPLLWQAIVLLALGTGAREGEIAGLECKNVHLDTGRVIIAQSALDVKGKGVVIKSTKTGYERDNGLPVQIIPIIKQYSAEREADKSAARDSWHHEWNGNPCDFFFTPDGGFGRPIRPDSISQWWTRFTEKHGLKHVRFHDLRHTSVALSIDAGEDPKAISERVGHSKIGTTMDIYGYLFEEKKSRSAELLNKQFSEIAKLSNGNAPLRPVTPPLHHES